MQHKPICWCSQRYRVRSLYNTLCSCRRCRSATQNKQSCHAHYPALLVVITAATILVTHKRRICHNTSSQMPPRQPTLSQLSRNQQALKLISAHSRHSSLWALLGQGGNRRRHKAFKLNFEFQGFTVQPGMCNACLHCQTGQCTCVGWSCCQHRTCTHGLCIHCLLIIATC